MAERENLDANGRGPEDPEYDPSSAAQVADLAVRKRGEVVASRRAVVDTLIEAQLRSREEDKIWETLRKAKPSFLKEGFGLRGPASPEVRRTTDFSQGVVARESRQPAFPPETAQQLTQTTRAVPNITFILSNASETIDGEVVRKVKVADGKINGAFPSGMGFNNYVLTLPDPADAIVYAGVTFNPTTLAITSRFLGASTAGTYPESRVESDTSGFLYWQLGFTYLDPGFKIINTRVGDINFEFSYGAFSGGPALLPVESGPGWLDLAFLL